MTGRTLPTGPDNRAGRWDNVARRHTSLGCQPQPRSLLEAAGITPAAEPSAVGRPVVGRLLAELPLVELPEIPAARHYFATTIDDRGRLADRTPLQLLNWGPGTPATIETNPTSGVIIVRRGGPDATTRQGFLRLPAGVRHDCRITAGQRLLVVADPGGDRLVLYTPSALDAMVLAYHGARAPRKPE